MGRLANRGRGIKGDKGDKGDKGEPGQTVIVGGGGGGGEVSSLYLAPESYGAVHNNITFAQQGKTQAWVDANYPGIGATVNDMIDWAAWQMVVSLTEATGKPIFRHRDGFRKGYRDWETDRKSTRLNSSHRSLSRMPSSA